MPLSHFAKIDRTVRNVKRTRDILAVLARHGFVEVVEESGLSAWAKEVLGVNLTRRGSDRTFPRQSRGERLCKVLEELGPTFIKIGQILSTRPDMLPDDLTEALRRLQSAVSPLPFSAIEQVLNEEFEEAYHDLFSEIDPSPIGSASLAQTHRATLRDGKRVVVKVLKPGMREQLAADLGILKELAEFTENHFSSLGFSPKEICSEFSAELREETNFLNEASNTERLEGLFQDDPSISVPKIYREASTKSVLCMELIEATLVANLDPKSLSPEVRSTLAGNAIRGVSRQTLEFGFFHGDPHAGNIFAYPDGSICFIDCGLTGQIERRTSEQIAQLCQGVARGEVDDVIDAARGFTIGDPSTLRTRIFRNDIWGLVGRFHQGDLASIQVGPLLSDFFSVLRKHHLRLPSDVVLLIKALSTMEGVVERIDPTFDLIGTMRPYLEGIIRKRYGARALSDRVRRSVLSYGELVEGFPRQLQEILDRLLSDRFKVHLEHRGLAELTRAILQTASSVSLSLLAAALVVGSSILVLADKMTRSAGTPTTVGTIGFVVAFVLMLRILAFMRR